MITSPISPEERHWRLCRLAQEYGIEDPPELTPLSRPPAPLPPSTSQPKNTDDEAMADELLKRRRMSNSQALNPNAAGGGLMKKRSLTLSRKDSFASKEIFEALDAHVADHGSPGVAEALIHKLRLSGRDLSNAPTNKPKIPFNLKRRSMDEISHNQNRILQKAVENGQEDMVAVLIPHADPFIIDTALPTAMAQGNTKITELLLAYGANLLSLPDGQFHFQQLCSNGENSDIVGLLLQSDGRPPPEWTSDAMVLAANKGDIATIVRLSRSTADASWDGAAALKAAITMCRVDIALAILTGTRPPMVEYLNEAFRLLFTYTNIMPTEKKAFADILLLAGAEGDVVSEALVQACDTEFYEMIDLLLSSGASVEFQDALVVRSAIEKGNTSLVELLLSGKTALTHHLAAELTRSIPKRITSENRRRILVILLKRGAKGPALDDALIDAVECRDLECAKLLLSSHFSGSGKLEPKSKHDIKRGPRSMVFEIHAIANTNHKGGLALSIAVTNGSVPIVDLILATKPNPEILVDIFPTIQQLDPAPRCRITESFLKAGVSGPCVHAALQQAIDEHPPRRDERLIGILLKYDNDANANDAAPIFSAIEHVDVDLFDVLLTKRPMTSRNATIVFRKAMATNNKFARLRMVSLLLASGADVEAKTVGDGMVKVLQEQPTDTKLLSVLLKQGNADVNMDSGDPIVLAVRNSDPGVLELMLQAGKPTPETMDLAVQAMSNIPSTEDKSAKLESILKRTKQKETLNGLIADEVQAILQCPPERRTLVTLTSLLAAGVDVNARGGAALQNAIAGTNSTITDVLLGAKVNKDSLKAAMPYALKIQDQADRLKFTQKLLHAGAPAKEVNIALAYAIGTYPDDITLIETLVAKADTSDGEALLEAVVRGNVVIVELILMRSKKHPSASLNGSFLAALNIQDQNIRRSICELLLKAGAAGPVISDALLAAAGTGDLTLGSMLLQHGANVDHHEGQAIVEACKSGSSTVLEMLLSSRSVITKEAMERGFQAATEIGDLKQRAKVFQLLLERGVTGPVVDAELVFTVKYGEDATDLVGLLLHFGANVDYNDGEAIYNATQCAFLGVLEMLLGVSSPDINRQKPSPETLVRALEASSKLSGAPRYQVIKWLFAAGLPVSDDIHFLLDKAVKDEDPNIDLIKLLLDNGALPTANGCACLIDAAQNMDISILDLFLRYDIQKKDADWIFLQAFSADKVGNWLSEPGLQVAHRLVERGAQGDGLSGALNVALDYLGTDRDGIAQEFIGLLLQNKANINNGQGEALVKAIKGANVPLIAQMMQHKPDVEAISMAFPYIFDQRLSEEGALELITLFTDCQDDKTRLDPMLQHPESESVIFKALSRYPHSTKIMQILLDAGYYHDQMFTARIVEELEEQVTLLIWCILQPEKKVSSGIITLLIEKGARVNFETELSKSTPLLLAIREKRPDIVKQLIIAGAEVDVADVQGNTPLTLTTQIGGELGTIMLSNILAAQPTLNDGSLHNAARDLNVQALEVLVEFRHEVDFPSYAHGGRTALGELCLHAADSGPLSAAQEKAMEKAIVFLLKQDTDLSLLTDGKSVLHLAMESADPVTTTRALLKAGLWKHVNQPCNLYTDGTYTYSPTQYVRRIMQQTDVTEQLYSVLKLNRAQDIYYANEGPQPEGAVGLPEDIVRAERERKARLERIQLEAEDHARVLAHSKEVAEIQNQILIQRAELEDLQTRQKQMTELEGMREKVRAEEEAFNDAVLRQRMQREAAIEHQTALTQAEVERKRLVAEAELEAEHNKQRLLLEYEARAGETKMDYAKQMSSLRRAERENIEGFEKEQDYRIRNRMLQESKMIDQKQHAAQNMAAMGIAPPRRQQIGYVAGELD